MKKVAIVYASIHHKNTEKLLFSMKKKYPIDLFNILNTEVKDLSEYEMLGFASGIYFSKFHKSIYEFLEGNENLPENVFLIYTSGDGSKRSGKKFSKVLKDKGFNVKGAFNCKGYDTFGPYKLIGGIAKGRPNEEDFKKVNEFLENILLKD
ncbi:flavodoxin [Anaerosphaera multitolerans]|uniref:Flavodoxin n=1 Tax=Anaerosphaera multitolerans TaxID=2487351 RepID=A0A437S645_9FIRM|nr:flavodoxin [Anaerosphaera multitolerans]RVU54490.1 flavodoxin [Anaerosphaera multitolerans]